MPGRSLIWQRFYRTFRFSLPRVTALYEIIPIGLSSAEDVEEVGPLIKLVETARR